MLALLALAEVELGFVDLGWRQVMYIEAEGRTRDVALFCCMTTEISFNIHFGRRLELKKFTQCQCGIEEPRSRYSHRHRTKLSLQKIIGSYNTLP